MTALQAYLQNSRTRKVLSKKTGSAGFSLIELVVVVAVLAVLAAIAIPAYNNITEKGRTSSAKTAVANAAKECAVSKANDGVGAHTALVDGSGMHFSAELRGTTCLDTSQGVCVDNTVDYIYGVNLATAVKTSGEVITSTSPLTTAGKAICAATEVGTAW